MKSFVTIFFILIVLAICDSSNTTAMDLTQFQWKNRLLFLFPPDYNHSFFKNLESEIITQQAEVKDRDLVVFEVLEQDYSKMNEADIDRQTADSIRDRFSVPPNTFSLILVGKDGGIKLKLHDQISLEEVFELIDSMPMRQGEMRQKYQ